MFSLTKPELDSMYTFLGKNKSGLIRKYVHTFQWNSQYLILNLWSDPLRRRVILQLKSRDGSINPKKLDVSLALLHESSTWSLISDLVRSYIPSSCAWVGDLEHSLRKVIQDLLSTDSRVRPLTRSIPPWEETSPIGTSADTESPKSSAGSSG